MNRFFGLVAAQFACLSLAQAAERVQWSMGAEASPVFAKLLVDSKAKEVTVENYDPARPITSADCVTDVLRPGRSEDDRADKANHITCTVAQSTGKARVTLSLAEQTISPWGNLGSTRAFSIRGSLVTPLARTMKNALEKNPEHPLLDSMDFVGPGGHRIVSYELKWRPDGETADGREDISPLVLSCNFNLLNDKVDGSFCSFLKFD